MSQNESFEGNLNMLQKYQGELNEWDEIKINLPWGVVAGKWYGPKNIRPIICLHGWLDNCGTFDTLIPLLSKHVGYLALDFPGHGQSSWIPNGMFYDATFYLHMLRCIMKEYSWKKISLLGHSMGAVMSFYLAALFPDMVDMIISLDTVKPLMQDADIVPDLIRAAIDGCITADKRNRSAADEPPSYSINQLLDKVHIGSAGSVQKEKGIYLIRRNMKESSKNPGKYFFTHDIRLKYYNHYFDGTQDALIQYTAKISAPHLFIKAGDEELVEKTEYHDEMLEVFKRKPNFTYRLVSGRHHVHLTSPETISDVVSDFINKNRPPELNSKL